jgi:hypothetical protein
LFTSMTLSSRAGTPFPLYVKRIGPSVINRFFASRNPFYIFPQSAIRIK